jgi:hypothetical protein
LITRLKERARVAVGLKNIHQRAGRRRLFAAAAGFLITPFAVSALQTERTPANATAHSSAATGPLPIFLTQWKNRVTAKWHFLATESWGNAAPKRSLVT